MQDKITTKSRQVMFLNYSKVQIFGENHQEIKILFMEMLRLVWTQGIPLTFRSRIFRLLILPKYIKFKIYRIIIFFCSFYGCETWSLTLKEEHMLRMFLFFNNYLRNRNKAEELRKTLVRVWLLKNVIPVIEIHTCVTLRWSYVCSNFETEQ